MIVNFTVTSFQACVICQLIRNKILSIMCFSTLWCLENICEQRDGSRLGSWLRQHRICQSPYYLLKHQELPEATSWQRVWTEKKKKEVRVLVFIKANMINTGLRQPKMVSHSLVESFNKGKHLFSQLWKCVRPVIFCKMHVWLRPIRAMSKQCF